MRFNYKFRQFFSCQNPDRKHKMSYYTMKDEIYKLFMLDIFHNLNPIRIHKGEKIFGELDDVDIVTFVMDGEYRIGYAINKEETMKMEFK